MHRASAAHADDMGEADLCALNLASSGLAAQMRRHLIDVGDARRAQWMAFGEQPAGSIHWNPSAKTRLPGIDEASRVAFLAEAEILVVHDLRRGKAIVQLYEVDVVRPKPCHLVGILRGHASNSIEV